MGVRLLSLLSLSLGLFRFETDSPNNNKTFGGIDLVEEFEWHYRRVLSLWRVGGSIGKNDQRKSIGWDERKEKQMMKRIPRDKII